MNINPFKKITDMKTRTGTKIVIINFIIILIIIIFMTIALPVLAIKWNIILEVIDKLHIDRIIIALLGQGSMTAIALEIRKAIENKSNSKNI